MMANNEIDLSGDGGVLKTIIVEGSGNETPSNGCKVSLHYTGKLTNGTIFDSSLERNEAFEFDLGKGSVIKAFDMGVAAMKKGEKCVLKCAPEYAYGSAGSPPSIPPDSTLIFELELLGWKGEDLSPNKDGSIERFIIKKSDKRKTPNDGAHVKIHLIGKYEEKIFEEREVEFDVGEGSEIGLIEGVEIAISKICVGETSRLKINPKYAFGDVGKADCGIPPNAVVEYIVTLIECEKAVEEWKLDKDESLVQAKLFKEKGNNYLKTEKYQLAVKMYNKCNNFLSNCDNEESQQIKLAIHLNIALCNQKIGDFFAAKSCCNSALEIDPNNLKGLYRRGQCYLSINDTDKALEDFQKVHELDPQNKAAVNQITICKKKIKEFHEKEKKVYANMFTKFAATDKQSTSGQKGSYTTLSLAYSQTQHNSVIIERIIYSPSDISGSSSAFPAIDQQQQQHQVKSKKRKMDDKETLKRKKLKRTPRHELPPKFNEMHPTTLLFIMRPEVNFIRLGNHIPPLVMKVVVDGEIFLGVGRSKKHARRDASYQACNKLFGTNFKQEIVV